MERRSLCRDGVISATPYGPLASTPVGQCDSVTTATWDAAVAAGKVQKFTTADITVNGDGVCTTSSQASTMPKASLPIALLTVVLVELGRSICHDHDWPRPRRSPRRTDPACVQIGRGIVHRCLAAQQVPLEPVGAWMAAPAPDVTITWRKHRQDPDMVVFVCITVAGRY